jgi:hypothetical protein
MWDWSSMVIIILVTILKQGSRAWSIFRGPQLQVLWAEQPAGGGEMDACHIMPRLPYTTVHVVWRRPYSTVWSLHSVLLLAIPQHQLVLYYLLPMSPPQAVTCTPPHLLCPGPLFHRGSTLTHSPQETTLFKISLLPWPEQSLGPVLSAAICSICCWNDRSVPICAGKHK